uniref:CCHC-type domain-containing protein n=1 Tax=Oryzias latipes TaxID=8090 RepID=A0A3B3HUH3_ORYLA
MQRTMRSGKASRGDGANQLMDSEAQTLEEKENGASGGTDCTEGLGKEPTIMDMMSLLRAHMGQQEAREAKQKEEQTRQEQRFRALQHQFQLLQVEVQARTTPAPDSRLNQSEPPDLEPSEVGSLTQSGSGSNLMNAPSGQSHFYEPRMERLTDEDDIEHFLTTFERIAAACRWQKVDWVFHLIPLLTGKARSAYVHMDVEDSSEYDKVKTAILCKYNVNPETYRQRFRSLDVNLDESPKELYARLKELYVKWIQPQGKTTQEIGEIIILEQYLRMLSPELQVWIKEHDPKSAAEAATLAEVFVAARKSGQPWSYISMGPKDKSIEQRPAPSGGKSQRSQLANKPSNLSARKLICYLCGMEGHTKPNCPQNSAKITQMCVVPRNCTRPENGTNVKLASVDVNGRTLTALMDSGSDQTFVRKQYVSSSVICTDRTIPVFCVHGDVKPYPTADLYIKVHDQTYLLNVGVVDDLPYPVVLGRDLPVLFDLLRANRECNVAVTQAQAKMLEEPNSVLQALPFFHADMENAPGKSRKSRRQKRCEKLCHSALHKKSTPDPEPPLGFKIPVNFVDLQRDDPTLAPFFQRAVEGTPETGSDLCAAETFFLNQGMLYRKQGSQTQLVAPQAVKDLVLTLGHSIPILGNTKPLLELKSIFFLAWLAL